MLKIKQEKLGLTDAKLVIYSDAIVMQFESYLKEDVVFKRKYKTFATKTINSFKEVIEIVRKNNKKVTDTQRDKAIAFARRVYFNNKSEDGLDLTEILTEADKKYLLMIDAFQMSLNELIKEFGCKADKEILKKVKTSLKWCVNFLNGITEICSE